MKLIKLDQDWEKSVKMAIGFPLSKKEAKKYTFLRKSLCRGVK